MEATNRSVVAIQHGRAIFSMSISFQLREDGLTHQFSMPEVPPPEDLTDERELREEQAKLLPEDQREQFLRDRPIEFRPVAPVNPGRPEKREPLQYAWMKVRDALPEDPRLHQCALAYLSDWSLLDTGTLPHALNWMNDHVQMASLDHSMWFHHPFRADDWLLYAQDSPSASGARSLNRGLIFDRSGQLVASAAQEGLMRIHDQSSSSA